MLYIEVIAIKMKDISRKLRAHPELRIAPEKVNGKIMYRLKKTPSAIGVWISREKVRQITDRIPEHVLPQYEAEAVVKIVQDFGLGEYALKITQRRHYDALMGDEHQRLPPSGLQERLEKLQSPMV